MSCYHPVGAVPLGLKENGKQDIKIIHFNSYHDFKEAYPEGFIVPCGKCIGCRLDYSRRWADRMMLELQICKEAIFVTLTYDCRHVVDCAGDLVFDCEYPEIEDTKLCPLHDHCGELCKRDGSLYKRHVQLFMKRFRKEMEKYDKKLRFFAVGEYGSFEKYTHRPHYHLILFGVGLDFFKNKKPVGFNELRQPVYTDPIIDSCWDHGNVSFGDVSWKSCAYVARYLNKKALDDSHDDFLDMLGKNHLFSLMSRKPGIGRPYLDQYPDCLDMSCIYLSTDKGALKVNIPRYFVNQLNRVVDDLNPEKELYYPEKYDMIIAQRALYAQDSILSKLNQTDKDLLEYLAGEEEEMLRCVNALKRDSHNLY